LERGEFITKIVGQTFVQLVAVQIRGQVRRVEERVRLFAIVLMRALSERTLEPSTLGSEQLTGPCLRSSSRPRVSEIESCRGH
jgi:hypothetical protein